MLICLICKRKCKNITSLSVHIRRGHKIFTKEYYDRFFKKDREEICKRSGCINETNFINMNVGYHKHCSNKCKTLDLIVQNKMKRSCRKLYGSDNAMQSHVCKVKSKRTFQKKYGVDNIAQTEKEREKNKAIMIDGKAIYMNSFVEDPSIPQLELYRESKDLYLDAEIEYWVFGKYRLDIAVPSLKVAIEYDGSYWHQDIEKDEKRDQYLESQGWKILRYRDYIPSKEQLRKDVNKVLRGGCSV